ncbi:MAG: AraC family transcriptional regulator [unclassified Hahellaceae]|nr:AraC family transcriptional regulator [Hahellaceae bacterium]|tara:strand:- start:24178 stop:25215 length:1038 start_codon:yes stop_codon:yes gene_type:complete
MSAEYQLSDRMTIASYFARTHLANGLSMGASEEHILRDTGLTPAQLAHPKARILAAQLADIVNNCWRFGDDELLGFTRQKMRVGMFRLLAEHLITCKDMSDVLAYIVRFYDLTGDQLAVRLHRTGDVLACRVIPDFKPSRPDSVPESLLIELLLLIVHRFLSWLTGHVIPLVKVCLRYPRPDHYQEYGLMFPSPCEFESPHNALLFKAEELDLPVVRNADELAGYLQQIPLRWFRKQSFHGVWTADVMRLLGEESDIEQVADRLSVTSRTLRRKLTGEGSRFQQLKDNARRDMAINLFEQRQLTIADIGFKVGFTEAATFSRAFKQWTGVTPSSYRKMSRSRKYG